VKTLKKFLIVVLVLFLCVAGYLGIVTYRYLDNDMAFKDHIVAIIIPGIKKQLGMGKDGAAGKNAEELPSINLIISSDNQEKLEEEMDRLLDMGFSFGDHKTVKVPAVLEMDGKKIEVKAWIRGDEPPNYEFGFVNASLSFSVEGDSGIMGMTRFSLLRPFLEYEFYGYFYYKIMESQGILANDLTFVQARLNGKRNGIFMLQEKFGDHLYTSSGKKEGFILKYKSDCVEPVQKRYHTNPELVPYREGAILRSELASDLQEFQKKFLLLRDGKIKAREVLDLDKYATFIALTDIFLAHHSHDCINTRLFYDPTTKKLEPIAWDPSNGMYSDIRYPKGKTEPFFFGYYVNYWHPIYEYLVRDEEFLIAYTKKMRMLASNDTIVNVLERYDVYRNRVEYQLSKQPFWSMFQKERIVLNLEHFDRLFAETYHLSANLYKHTKVLEIYSVSDLPVRIDSITIDTLTIKMDTILIPRKSIRTIFDGDVPSDKIRFRVHFRFLDRSDAMMVKGRIYEDELKVDRVVE